MKSVPIVGPDIDLHRRDCLRRAAEIAALAAFGGPLSACGGAKSSAVSGGEVNAQATTFADGLEYPWGLTPLSDGRWLVTEKPGRLRIVSADGRTLGAPIANVPAVDYRGQGGLLDVEIDPDFANNRRVYLSFAEAGTGAEAGLNSTAVARGVLATDDTALTDVQVIFRQTPKIASTGHFGGRLVFAHDGSLFVTLGERQTESAQAQTLVNHIGKIVRLRTDGSAAPDNPFVATSGAAPEIWSLGHRNVQGAAVHPGTGELWVCEHGPQGGDEINIARKGRNYGWPLISYGCNYGATPVDSCTPVGGATSGPGLEQPQTYWVPISIAPSGLAFYTADLMPAWKGSVFVGALAGMALWRLTLAGDAVVAREALFSDLRERIRAVKQGRDGALYMITDNAAGRMLRIAPAA